MKLKYITFQDQNFKSFCVSKIEFEVDFVTLELQQQNLIQVDNFWVLGKYTDPRIHGPHTRTFYLFLIFGN